MRKRTANSANNWWECSPRANTNNSNNFCNVNSDGSANNNNASNSNGLAPFGYIIDARKVASVKLVDFDTGVCYPRPKRANMYSAPPYEIGGG